ncbi:hypothetical protein D3C81_1269040 [compost metagenome]
MEDFEASDGFMLISLEIVRSPLSKDRSKDAGETSQPLGTFGLTLNVVVFACPFF